MSVTEIQSIIDVNRVPSVEVSAPSKIWIALDFFDEALNGSRPPWFISQASASTQLPGAVFVVVIQIHINGMSHQVVAIGRGRHYGWTYWSTILPEGTRNQYLRNTKREHLSIQASYNNNQVPRYISDKWFNCNTIHRHNPTGSQQNLFIPLPKRFRYRCAVFWNCLTALLS